MTKWILIIVVAMVALGVGVFFAYDGSIKEVPSPDFETTPHDEVITIEDLKTKMRDLDAINVYPKNKDINPRNYPIVLGTYSENGLTLIEEYFCSDVCPDAGGVTIVFQDITSKEECAKAGGKDLIDPAWGGYIGCAPIIRSNSIPVDIPDLTTGWKTFVNQEYGFEIKYPETWNASKPDRAWGASEPNEGFYEVTFLEEYLGYWQGQFRLIVTRNSEDLTVPQWIEKRLQEIDEAETKCKMENPNSPCFIGAPEEIEGGNQSTVGGLVSYSYRFFQFDSYLRCDYVTKNRYIYKLCYDSLNINDNHFDEHRKISSDMVSSFRFLD